MSTKSLGPFKTGRALNLLFDRFSSELTKEELEFIASASDHAEEQAENMADILNNLASLINHQGAGKETGFGKVAPNLLWQTSYVFEEIAGLIHLASNAEFLLRNPDAFKPDKEA